MNAGSRLVFALSLAVAGAAAWACVGDDPQTATPAPDSGSSSGDTGASSSGGSSGTPSDGGLTCPSGELPCDGACINPKTSKKHCGRCTHDCGTGDCNAGVCTHKLIAGDPAPPDAGSSTSITSLATDQTSDDPKGLAQKVFWSVVSSTSTNGVYQDNVLGGTTLKLSTAAISVRTNVVANQGSAYWSRFSVGGGPLPQPVVKGTVGTAASEAPLGAVSPAAQIQSIDYDVASKYVVGSFKVDGTNERAFRCGPTDGTVTCAAIGTAVTGDPGGNVALDAANVYFAASADGIIYYAAKDGTGSTVTYKASEIAPAHLRVDGADLFWGSSTDKVIRRGTLGTVGTVVPVATGANTPSAIAADAVNVYWTDPVLGTVNYAPRAGTGPNTPYVTLGPSSIPMRLVRDTGFLYFTHNGGIYRVALP